MPKGKTASFRIPSGNLLSGRECDVFKKIFAAAGEPVDKDEIQKDLKLSESNLVRNICSIRDKLGSDSIVTEGGKVSLGNVSGMTVGLKGALIKRSTRER